MAVSALSKGLSVEDSPRLDHDTYNRAGTPAITETIFDKIRHSAVVLADLTFVGDTKARSGQKSKRLSNPNVLLELGYAAASIGWDRMILVMNKHYGGPESLPFDLRFRRFPITFTLGPQFKDRQPVIDDLAARLESAIGTCLAAEYTRVDRIMTQLTTSARRFILTHYTHGIFFEVSDANTVASRDDLAVMQLLELEVIQCIKYAADTQFAYTWTYLGRQCIIRLGLPLSPVVNSDPFVVQSQVRVEFSSYEALADEQVPCDIRMPIRFTDDPPREES